MSEFPTYSAVFSNESANFIVSLSRRKQIKVLDISDRIGDWPEGISDVTFIDATNHTIHSVLIDEFLFNYWIDHSSCEVRITEIIVV